MKQEERGMTLIEVMVSVAVIGMIMVILWSSSGQLMRAKENVKQKDRAIHQLRSVLVKIGSDLNSAFLSKISGGIPEGTESPDLATAKTITFFKGKESGNKSELAFTSLSHLRLFKNAKESDQCKVLYSTSPSKDNPEAFDIIRVEIPWLDSSSKVEGEEIVIAEGLRDFKLEYYDDQKDEWGKEWNTEGVDWRGRLPKAVKVTVSIVDPNDKEKIITLMTSFWIPMYKGTIQL